MASGAAFVNERERQFARAEREVAALAANREADRIARERHDAMKRAIYHGDD